ncbi:hypothetical protein [Bradyrhizobium liaoningense]|uniref:hypothetical protein n=2 Tax=Bradyrhizobium TaxID=374 RepID=UPI001BA59B23|nr:hypothetical protein [Bradyrhizobium liaoningense]
MPASSMSATDAIAENSMQQVFSCTRASRAIDPTVRIVTVEITLQRRFADSESRFLATKIFS